MAAGGAPLHDRAAQEDREASIMSVAEVRYWFERAKAGDVLVYARGPYLIRGETADFVRDLALRGLTDLAQPRARGGQGFEFKVQKRAPRTGGLEGVAGFAQDDASEAILRALKRAANFGKRCPTDTELARLAGLPTRNAAAWRVRKLIEAGAIRSDTIESGREAGWRTITIVATGRQTMAPPSLAALKASIAREASE